MNFIRSGTVLIILFILAPLSIRADDLPSGTFPKRCSYTSETSIGGVMKMAKNALSPTHPSGTTTKVGPDNLNGIDCTKYSVVTSQGKRFLFWYDSSDHPVKIASEDNSYTTTFMNYQEGVQQDALFQPPGSYKQVDAPKRVPRPSNLPPLPEVNGQTIAVVGSDIYSDLEDSSTRIEK